MNSRKILVIGYYHRKNLGDDVFEYVLTRYFQDRWSDSIYIFISIDDLNEIPIDTSAVIFGGGDLINDYFFNKIKPFIYNKFCPWYAISIGIPYPSLIDRGYLDKFDYIIHRNQTDQQILFDKYPNRSEWFPDMSFMLPLYNNSNNMIEYKKNKYESKKIGICLSRSIYNKNNPESYNLIVNNISKFLSDVASLYRYEWSGFKRIKVPLYQLYFVPFCNDEDGEDDNIINNDIYTKIKQNFGEMNNVYLTDSIYIDKIIPIFNSFHLTICTRFHAHIFSLMTKTPFLSIYTTRKVENFVKEIGLEDYACKMEIGTKDFPININIETLMNTFLYLEETYCEYIDKLDNIQKLYSNNINLFINRLDNLLFYNPIYIFPNNIEKEGVEIAYKIANRIINIINPNNNDAYDMISMSNNALVTLLSKDSIDDRITVDKIVNTSGIIGRYLNKDNKNNIIEIILYELTKDRFSPYHYGLSQQIFTNSYNLKESCIWIVRHKYNEINNMKNYNFINNSLCSLSDRKLNVNYIDNNLLSGYHRSGWSYVLDGLNEVHNPKGIIFDSYLDKTFGWEYEFLTLNQVIPYRKDWIGIFHHTANEDYTENNLNTFFNKPNFLQSLDTCRGIITLSNDNYEWIVNKLISIDKCIPVLPLIHPTEFVPDNLKFNLQLFKMNPVKKVIQIGAWLRDSYAIYDLDVPCGYYKFALKGKNMENYFISNDDMETVIKNTKNIGASKKCRASDHVIHNKDANKHIVGMLDMIKSNYNSVTILENISNDQYDELLKSNVVFIKLIDAAAVNTILECIVRNTPILVNRLPATEEYLGKNYPLFYDRLNEVNSLLSIDNITKANKYLSKLNKNRFTIKYFIDNLIQSKLYQDLK